MPAQAQSAEAQTSIAVGVGAVSGSTADRALFDQYSGIPTDSDAAGLLGFDYSLRQEEANNWMELHGSDLLIDTRELNLDWRRPGDWKFSAGYGELVRNDPYQVNTGLINPGSAAPTVEALLGGAGTGSNFDLQTKRSALGVGYTKIISPRMQFAVDLKSENKSGSRLFGIGMNCPTSYDPGCSGTTGIQVGWATLMMPEPIDANHSQIDARLSYALEKLRLSVGYYGSFYRNKNSAIYPDVAGNLYNPVGTLLPVSPGLLGYLNQPISLPPDSQAHQLDVTGNYAFTDKTRATFKLAYSAAMQDDAFVGPSRTGATSLDGRVNTALAQFGVTSRPMPKLDLSADVRYFNKEDVTPLVAYNIAGNTPYTNQNLSGRKSNAKLQANWQFNSDYRGTLAADYEFIDRNLFTASSAVAGITALRENTDEAGLRAELRRRMSETLSGAISYSRSNRNGSSWLRDNSGLGVSGVIDFADPAVVNGIFAPTLADRQRDKVKIYADWMPTKDWSVQFSAEDGTDKYTSPSVYGLRDTSMNHYSVDWSYAVSFRVQLNGYASRGVQTFNQSRYAGYVMSFENTSTTFGLGFTAKPTNQWDLGGSLSYIDDTSKYGQTLDATADAYTVASLAASGGLPDIDFQQTTLKLFGKYAIDKKSAVRVDFVHQRSTYNDWAWGYSGVPYTYSDGTTLGQDADQKVSFIGVTYLYSF
ncbi:MtrB/PioB family decaheme-associated outer membrane protein [Rhodoferax sp.]|uniref:MtrB/PioB family decaheme-associated outer membrane protein n=1 Tax=Rhodoferax sp. TaxID=50421 RepID=UPI0025F95206|nr:MtrB/PioB family decaheme-associated outer membrane protein [Rhodoferax sp.]